MRTPDSRLKMPARLDTSPDDRDEPDDFPVQRLTVKQRLVRAINIAVILALALDVFTGHVSQLLRSGGQLSSSQPQPSTAIRFTHLYVDLDVPWVAVAVDGHPLQVSAVGSGSAPALARGRHVITWSGEPFEPQSCVLTLPAIATTSAPGDTCAPLLEGALPLSSGDYAGVFHATESLATVQSAARPALLDAIQTALDAKASADTVQPGERYVLARHGIVTATAPLRAQLSFTLDAEPAGGPPPCRPDAAQPATSYCAVEIPYCLSLCALPWTLRAAEASSQPLADWLAFAVYHSTWSYTTLDGTDAGGDSDADPLGSAIAGQRALLRIAWSGGTWHVSSLFDADLRVPLMLAGRALVADPACATAEDFIGGSETAQERSDYTQIRAITGPDLARGCVLVATVASITNAPNFAIYLYRFGILYAASDLANHYRPTLPLASPNQRQLALQFNSLPGHVIFQV